MTGVVPQDRVERFHDWHLDPVLACPPDERALKCLDLQAFARLKINQQR